MSTKELRDVYDENRPIIGQSYNRILDKNEYYLSVACCIFNHNNEMLIQKRANNNDVFANLWDISVQGKAIASEDSKIAMAREIKEEIGLDIDLKDHRCHMSLNYDFGFVDVYLLNMDIDLDQLVLQKEEVQAVKWANIETIKQLIACKQFVPYYNSFIDICFDAKEHYGTFLDR